ncbi:MAG: NAD-dependent epimerase/dehydratase family protein [Flavobacteriaceae bacterium]|jgi:nucleoside-diphosphate-sugar epimerase|nr:NAD-dependent epimerase/dehydratase family protein [Flavobacteriaceae bacterium]
MKTIGILGCGWLGLSLGKVLVEQGYKVKGSTTTQNKVSELKEVGITPYLLDLATWDEAQGNLFFSNIDTLILTIPPIRNEEQPTYLSTYTRLLPYIHQHNIKEVIYTSSVSVYAASPNIITEECILYATEQTAVQIREVEELLLKDSQFTTRILRLGGLFGGEREPVRYICQKHILDNPGLPINMIHLDDIIRFTQALLSVPVSANEIYNLVSPLYKDRYDYYKQRAELYNLTLPQLSDNNWPMYKKISGEAIARTTGLDYQY